MLAAYLPGDSTVDLRRVDDPRPGHGEVLLRVHASTICGSDLRAIYREHLGEGPEAYQGVVAGHEPAGEVIALGEGVIRAHVGDRAAVYHIHGCGQCSECRRGYQISCTSPARAAYGWQRDGGHAEFLVASERDLVFLPDSLSYVDGACVACGFGTAYEALRRVGVSGRDEVLVTGLGPVGVATGLLAKALGAARVVGVELNPERAEFAAGLGAVDGLAHPDGLVDLLPAGADVAVDCSGSGHAQRLAIQHTRRWGAVALVGEGATLTVDVSAEVIHKQLTLHGSWVSSTWRMQELVELLDRWQLHPEVVVSDRFPLAEAASAYRAADSSARGKVAVLPSAG